MEHGLAVIEDACVTFVAHGGQRDVIGAGVHAFRHVRGGIEHFQIGVDIEVFDGGFHVVADAFVFLRHQNVDWRDVVHSEIRAHPLPLFKVVGVQAAQVLIPVFQRADRPS